MPLWIPHWIEIALNMLENIIIFLKKSSFFISKLFLLHTFIYTKKVGLFAEVYFFSLKSFATFYQINLFYGEICCCPFVLYWWVIQQLFHNLSRRAKINRGYVQLLAWIGSRILIVSDYSPATWEREPAASALNPFPPEEKCFCHHGGKTDQPEVSKAWRPEGG